jgi:hypothetical protein
MLTEAGFTDCELVSETGFNSTPKTRGVLIRARKPESPMKKIPVALEGARPPSPRKRSPSVNAVLEKAFALGVEKAKVIDAHTVVVEKWVRWKCLYGCPFYNKDAYHPPIAPDAEETRQVIGEYTKAVLLNGSRGKELSQIAIRLEEEAYRMGFYKAFAMTALPPAPPENAVSGST